MRTVFWILLLANVTLFSAAQRGWLVWGEQAPQAQPVLRTEMIRLLDEAQQVPGLMAPVSARPATTTTAPVSVPVPVPVSAPAAVPVAAKPGKLSCWEWGDFSGTDLSRALVALSALQLGDKLSQRQVEYDTGYWVYIPPLKSKAAISRKIAELKARGIGEYFVVQNADQWRNAISLGVFKTQEAARHFLDDLRSRNVRSAQLGQRASKFKVTQFGLNEIGILTEVKLATLQKEFTGSELKQVPCALTR